MFDLDTLQSDWNIFGMDERIRRGGLRFARFVLGLQVQSVREMSRCLGSARNDIINDIAIELVVGIACLSWKWGGLAAHGQLKPISFR